MNRLTPIMETVATTLMRRFYRWVERPDLLQELNLWVCQHPNRVAEWLDDEDEKAAEAQLFTSLRNAGLDFCQREKAAQTGYKVEDLYYWQRNEVKDGLRSLFDKDAWLNPPVYDETSRSSKSPSEGGNWIASLADLARAYSDLNGNQKDMLWRVFGLGESQRSYAESEGLSESVVSDRIDAAVRKMHDALGGMHPKRHPVKNGEDCECWGGPGSRRVVSNAEANAMIGDTYNG